MSYFKKLHFTINRDDKVLKKFGFKLAGKFNPTDLGYTGNGYEKLVAFYHYLEYTDYHGLNGHSFPEYINDDRFIKILNNMEVQTN